MKRLILILLIFEIGSLWSFSQNKTGIIPCDNSSVKSYKPPFISSENFIFSKSDFRWKPKTEYNFANFTLYSNNFDFSGDLFTVNHRYYYIAGLSIIVDKGPYAMMYYLPFGFRLPLISGRNYSLILGNYYYLLPSQNNYPGHTEHFDEYNIQGTEVDINLPRFIDNQIRFETNFVLGLSVFLGYRHQLSEYTVTKISNNEVEFTGKSLNGMYAGVSFNLGLLAPMEGIRRCYNIGRKAYADAGNSVSSLQDFIYKYPGTPYAKNAAEEIEYLVYCQAFNGNLKQCNDYLNRYPTGTYVQVINKKKEDLVEEDVYRSAQTGGIAECDNYLKKYPGGKYVQNVNDRKIERYNKIEYEKYTAALKGEYKLCDKYIQDYPNGKYIAEVKRIRAEKYAKEETDKYSAAVHGSYKDCDNYINQYPDGVYLAEVKKQRTEKYNVLENTKYNIAIKGSYMDCDNYLKEYPDGRYIEVVKKTRDEKYAYEETEYYKNAINGNYKDCDQYLLLYPKGKYVLAVDKAKNSKLSKVENNDVNSVASITSQELLARIAMEHPDQNVRIKAIEMVTNQTLLVKLALNKNEETSIRIAAISQVKDQILLMNWAQNDPQAAIRQIASEQITDDSFLLERLPLEPSSAVRASMIGTLHEKASLRTVALTAYHEDDRNFAFKRLSSELKDPAKDILNAAVDLDRRVNQIRNETDQNKLLETLLKGEFDVLQTAAARAISDLTTLEQAALQSKDRDVLKIVFNKIDDENVLKRISVKANDKALRLAAAKKCGSVTWVQIFDDVTSKGSPTNLLGDAIAAVSLFTSFQAQANEGVQQACLNLIRKGDESRIPEMEELLESYGDIQLAEDYLNCGQPDLYEAAASWVNRRGYRINSGNGSSRASWGSGRK